MKEDHESDPFFLPGHGGSMKFLIVFLLVLSSCSHKPKHQPSEYRPAVLPQALPPTGDPVNDSAAQPGSPQSPPVQQLPKASP